MPVSAAANLIEQTRADLATALRAAAYLNLNEGVDNHFTARVPGMADHYFINPKMHWSLIRTRDILMVDGAGRVVDGSGKPPMTGPNIHIPVHRAHPRGGCVFHVHMPWATALTCVEGGRLEMCHQSALRFFDDVAYDDEFNGFATAQEEGRRMASACGDKTILFLASHGVLCVTETIAEAIDHLYFLERTCQMQVLAASTGRKLRRIPDATARDCHKVLLGLLKNGAIVHFESLKQIVPEPAG
ncbi:MAG TPA: class II aldolase/adducin family protein [Acetobacteraceae bacterium]|nr:class II aldolase/adducin family protein [Acetobacteraceae bacterium]